MILTIREASTAEEAAARALILQGPYTALAIAEERVQQLQKNETDEITRLNAIRRLKAAIDEAKAEVLAGISGPVEKRAPAMLEHIIGRPFAQVQLGDGMGLESIVPTGCTETAPVDQLSAGEQEQIHFATRLALAEVLSQTERQVLVLDDPFVNTDPERLPRALQLIKEKSDRFQFVILSCHPERYLDLSEVAIRHMEQVESSEAIA